MCAALAGIPALISVNSVVPVSKILFMAILLHSIMTVHSFVASGNVMVAPCAIADRRRRANRARIACETEVCEEY